jgi:cytidylate kinase
MTYWKKKKDQLEEIEKVNRLPFITISREYGCCGFQVAEELVEILNKELNPEPKWAAYDKKILEKLMIDTGLSSSLVETLTGKARNNLTDVIQTFFSKFPPQVAVHKKVTETITMLALNGNVVIVGRGSNMITKKFKNGFHIRLVAPLERRAENISKFMNISKGEVTKLINEKTKQREDYLKEFFKFDLTDPHHYDLIINQSRFTIKQIAKIIIDGMKIKGLVNI